MKHLQEVIARSSSSLHRVERRMVASAQIADAMEKCGMSKSELARKMGKSQSEVTRWLSGTCNFTSDTLADISDVLGKDITGVGASELTVKVKVKFNKNIACDFTSAGPENLSRNYIIGS